MEPRKFVTRKTLVRGGFGKTRKWSEWAVGDIVIGQFLGTKVDPTFNRENVNLKVEEAFFADKAFAESIKGQEFVLNSCKDMADAIPSLQVGDVIQVELTGRYQIKQGPGKGKDGVNLHIQIVDEEDGGESLAATFDEPADDDLL